MLEEQAAAHEHVRGALLSSFQQYGYQLVQPPLMEFETSMFADAGHKLRAFSFQLIDPGSHHLMGIRPDMTTQVARIAISRLANVERPLRLCYAGEVVRTKGEGLEGRRQRTQVGYELIGQDSVEADLEVMRVAVNALHDIGVKDLAIDVIIPPIVRELCAHLNLDQAIAAQLKEALSKKDIHLMKSITGANHSLFVPLVTLYSSVTDTLSHIQSLPLSKTTLELCDRLSTILNAIQLHYPDVNISIDAAEADYFDYHTGIGFSIFSRKTAVELGRGGRYHIQQSEHQEAASGFTLYVDSVSALVPVQPMPKKILVSIATANDVIASLHQQGFYTLFASSREAALKVQAQSLQCYGWYENGNIHAVT